MASFFKKALGVFVEFEDTDSKPTNQPTFTNTGTSNPTPQLSQQIHNQEAEKFEKYFNALFEKANLPGPDYFEFHQTMDLLEAHITDEKARISASFATLSIQGLTKTKLLDTASQYKEIIAQDYVNFEKALNDKIKNEVGGKRSEVVALEQKIKANQEQILKLTKEITETQQQIGKLTTEAAEVETKLSVNKAGYQMASKAMINQISSDIVKIQSTL